MVERARILKPIPILYLVLERKDLFAYLIEQNKYIFIKFPLILYTLFAVVYK